MPRVGRSRMTSNFSYGIVASSPQGSLDDDGKDAEGL